jgi:hypothetical protein
VITNTHFKLAIAVTRRMHRLIAEIGDCWIGGRDPSHPAQIDNTSVAKVTRDQQLCLLASRVKFELRRLNFDAFNGREIDRRSISAGR